MGRLLVSVRGPVEALAAARGGAHIADVEHPSSALGTPYPLNIKAVRESLDSEGFGDLPISTNIGEEQRVRSSACQAALGVAIAGANHVKCGFAGLDPKAASYLGRNLVRTMKEWFPECKVYPEVFSEEEFAVSFDPLADGPRLAKGIACDGLLIDTFRKDSIAGTIGRTAIVRNDDLPANTNQALAIIRGTSARFLPGFLVFALQTAVQRSAAKAARGSGMNNISLEDVKSFDVPIPPKDEQTEILRRVRTLLSAADMLANRIEKASPAESIEARRRSSAKPSAGT